MCVCACVCVCVCVRARVPSCVEGGGRRREEFHLSVTFCVSSNVLCVFTHRPQFIESSCNPSEQGLAPFFEQGDYRSKWLVMVLPKIIPQRLLLLSRFSRVRLCATPKMPAHQAPPSLGFSKQEHWSGLPFPSPMHESEK